MGEDSRAVWRLLQRKGRSPRKSRVEKSKETWAGRYCSSDTLALKDAVQASAVARRNSHAHHNRTCGLHFPPSHW